jgi:hypothetical protein
LGLLLANLLIEQDIHQDIGVGGIQGYWVESLEAMHNTVLADLF